MPMTVTCPQCNRPLNVPDELMGKRVKCPGCQATFDPADPPPPTPPEPEPRWEVADQPPTLTRSSRRQPPPEIADQYPEERDDEPDDQYDDRPSRRSEKPGKVMAIAIMTLIGGIMALIYGGILTITCYGLLWPGTYYAYVFGIMAIIQGSQMLGENAHRMAQPKWISIMQIICILNCDVTNCVMGIVSLIFHNEPEVQRYFRG